MFLKMNWFCRNSQDPPANRFTNTWLARKEQVPLLYLGYHWILAVLCLAGLIQSIVLNTEYFLSRNEDENVYKYLIYLTSNGRLVAVIAFMLEAGIVTSRYVMEHSHKTEEHENETSGLPPMIWILWIMSNINSSLSVMITLVYWSFLYRSDRHFLDFENFSGHLMIAMACLLDVFISNRPWRLQHCFHPVVFCLLYGLFTFIYHLSGGTNYYFEPYVYHIIDWDQPIWTLLYILGVVLVLVVFHSMFYLLYLTREKCTQRWTQRNSGDEKSASIIEMRKPVENC